MTTEELDEHSLAAIRLAHALRDCDYHFTTATPATHARVNARPENTWARDLRDVFGWSRPFDSGLLPADIMALMQQAELLEPVTGGWRSRVRLSTLGGRLYMHSAFPTDSADAVFFGPDTYRFIAALNAHMRRRRAPVRRALELCCGAGPAAIEMALVSPQAQVIAADINPSAVRMTRINAALAGADNVTARQSDLLAQVRGHFDLIVANPPYLVDPQQRAYRHGGGALGADVALAIVEAALPRLAPGASLLLYTGAAIVAGEDAFAHAVRQRLDASRFAWTYREIDPDVFGEELDSPAYRAAERIAAVVLTVARF